MICNKCNSQNKGDSLFCENCGAKLHTVKSKVKFYTLLIYIAIATILLFFFNQTIFEKLSELVNLSQKAITIILTVLFSGCSIGSMFSKYRLTLCSLLLPLVSVSIFGITQNTNVKEIKNSFDFESKIINIAQGTTLQEAVYNIYPQLQIIENTYNIGGTKLIAEMSADFIGISQSYFNYEQNIEIKNYNDLKLTYIDNSQNIINQIINNNISVNITSISSNWSAFYVYVDVVNNTNRSITVIIDQGQMIEVQAVNVQNLVVYEALTVVLQPNEHKKISLKAYCAAEKRGSPVSKRAKLTPFKLNAPQSAFNSQEDVWNFINPARKR